MHRLFACVAATLLAAAVPLADAAETPPLGTWTGWINDRTENELTIHHVERGRHVHGYYCVRRPGVFRWYDFVPGGTTHGSVDARARGRNIVMRIGKFDLRFRPHRSGKSVRFTARSEEAKHGNDLVRDTEGPCLARLHPLRSGNFEAGTPPGVTVAEQVAAAPSPKHPLVGSWIGSRPSGLRIELNVIDVAPDGVTGLYCNTTTEIWRAFDMGSGVVGGIVAAVKDQTLSWEMRDRRFTFRVDPDRPDSMVYVQIRPTGTRTLAMTRTTSPPCAQRVVALDG